MALLVPIDSAVSFTQGDEPRQALAEWQVAHPPPLLYEQALLASSRPLADAGAWPSSASQLADAKAESTSFLFSTPPGLKPDWRDGDKIDETAFDVTEALRDDLEKEMGPATAGALLGGMEQQEVREALLPAFLLPVPERPEINKEMADMQPDDAVEKTSVHHPISISWDSQGNPTSRDFTTEFMKSSRVGNILSHRGLGTIPSHVR